MASTGENPTTPVVFGNVNSVVADRIREMILSGRLKPGERLRLSELAAELNVSTTPVREALRRLQADGLVVFYPRQGATVAQLSLSEYEEIFGMRKALEPLACRWAAEDFRRIPIERLRHLLEGIEEAEAQHDAPRRTQLVRDFWFTIFEASEKQHLLRVLSGLWDLSQQYRRYYSAMTNIASARLKHFHRIYRACEAQDLEALINAFQGMHAFLDSILIETLRASERENEVQGR